ncbi:DUF3131 domain-containing protein [Photobacterium nomapromontoriensis]|uniref:DUF3131 domain-containing protein n=1 Tax=Photobacterium nomapromontoriensis TaxID=2910237 RepID=UPI003D0A1E4E
MGMMYHYFLFFLCLLFPIFFPLSCIANTQHKAKFPEISDDVPPSFYGQRAISPSLPISNSKTLPLKQHAAIAQPIADKATQSLPPKPIDIMPTIPIPLNRHELLLAKKAQYYIDRNWNQQTGLIDSVQGYHHSTMWDVASGLAAILSLEGIGLYTEIEATSKIRLTLHTLERLPLYDERLPNREYDTHTAQPSGNYSSSSSKGNGWSALDIGRLLIWLEITARHKPQFISQITAIKTKWQLSDIIKDKTLYGELKTSQHQRYRQEGRLGYLQYAAQGLELAGFDVSNAFQPDHISSTIIDNTIIYTDDRNLPYFTADPYVLNAIELGQTNAWWDQLIPLFHLHKNKSRQERKLWIFAEDAMDRSPWFSYNNIYIYGKSWLSTAPGGKPIENPQIFSNKVAQGFSVIFYDDEFSQQLSQQIIDNSLAFRAIPTGLYKDNAPNTAFNINTNSLVLASLWYKHRNYAPLIIVH